MECDSYCGQSVDIEYYDGKLYRLSAFAWSILITEDDGLLLSIYGQTSTVFAREVLALAEWCEEGLQWNG